MLILDIWTQNVHTLSDSLFEILLVGCRCRELECCFSEIGLNNLDSDCKYTKQSIFEPPLKTDLLSVFEQAHKLASWLSLGCTPKL